MSKFVSAAFVPDSTVELTNVTTTSQRTALDTRGDLVRVCNGGTPGTHSFIYAKLKKGGALAADDDWPIMPGECAWFVRNPDDETHVAVIANTGTIPKVYATTAYARR